MFFNSSSRKVFCIGFNKTGSTSLHNLFLECGLSSSHSVKWPYYSKIKHGKKYLKKQCFSDGEQSNFVNLDTWFPNSLFILNDRDEKAWLRSRIKHIMKLNDKAPLEKIINDIKYRQQSRDFYFDEETAIKKWVCEKRIYVKQANEYFKNRPAFLNFDISKTNDVSVDLLSFFKKNNFPITLQKTKLQASVRHNARDESEIQNQQRLREYFSLIDNILDSDF